MQLIVYADLNCPFCYALHERLLSLGRLPEVEWRSVEHFPSVTFDVNDLKSQTELLREITELRNIASEIDVIIPPARPNSHIASAMLVEAEKLDRNKAINFRTLIYRSLWQEGNDFSNPELLDTLRIKADLPELTVTQYSEEQLKDWIDSWENGDFSRFLPALATNYGNKLLGLPNYEFLNASFTQNMAAVVENSAVCTPKEKEIILIASNNEDSIEQLTRSLSTNYQLDRARSGPCVVDSCLAEDKPDLVLLDTSLQEADCYSICTLLKGNPNTQNISLALFSTGTEPGGEVKAFDAGANEFMTLPTASDVIKARIRVLLRTKRVTELLEQFSKLDCLTEIANRREFDGQLERQWLNARRANTPLSLIILDVDYFKRFNDHYGHLDGDQCLKEIAQIIKKSIRRPHDSVARYGGEEFVVLLPNTDSKGAVSVAKNIQNNLSNRSILHEDSDVAKRVTVSQGIAATTPNGKVNPPALLNAADSALYVAKKNGRNCYAVIEL